MLQADPIHTTAPTGPHAACAVRPGMLPASRKMGRRARAAKRAIKRAARSAEAARLRTPLFTAMREACVERGIPWVRDHVQPLLGPDGLAGLTDAQAAGILALAEA